MLYDNSSPRYLPHLDNPEVIAMRLSPLGTANWIETDNDLARYHQHKLGYRVRQDVTGYMATDASLPAQQELSDLLLLHLCHDQAEHYHRIEDHLNCPVGDFSLNIRSAEPLWNCSLWVADDLVLMEEINGEYFLTAASLCCPSHWKLEEKFNRPLREIHDPVPGLHRILTPKIDRFFRHLKPEHPVFRFNWSLQTSNSLDQRPEVEPKAHEYSEIFYRAERQSLIRLPRTGAIAFTIRIYLHPLESLLEYPGALPALFDAIDNAPAPLAHYKRFTELAPCLRRYRQELTETQC